MNKQEIWMPVKDFINYEVSNFGRVRSLNYNHTGKVRFLKFAKSFDGYLSVVLYNHKMIKKYRVHRLVYETFVGEIPEGMQIDHQDGDKTNNRLENLRCVSPYENTHNPVTRPKHIEANRKNFQSDEWKLNQKKGCIRSWRNNPDRVNKVREVHGKPVLQIDCNTGQVIREFECVADAKRILGFDNSLIAKCCKGMRRKAYGFYWKYA